jgi:hypothetical protein
VKSFLSHSTKNLRQYFPVQSVVKSLIYGEGENFRMGAKFPVTPAKRIIAKNVISYTPELP